MTQVDVSKWRHVNFASAFGSETTPCISHVSFDGEKSACGRRGFVTSEDYDAHIGPDCQVCRRAAERLAPGLMK